MLSPRKVSSWIARIMLAAIAVAAPVAPVGAAAPLAPVPAVAATLPTTWTRISFAAGATSGGVSGSLAAGEVKEFRVAAGANQLMFVDLTTPKPDVFIEVVGVTGGQVLVRASDKKAHTQSTLPSKQDYLIRVVSTGGDSTFALKVTIPRRISFAAGATSATLAGTVAAGTTNTYIIRALKDQTITVTAGVTGAGQAVAVGVYGLGDGKPVAAITAGVSSVSGKLPATQDYIIHVVPSSVTSSYNLVVTIK